MSRNLPTTVLQKFCPQEWVAKAYSEYMLDCARSMQDILDATTTLSTDEDIDSLADQLLEQFDQVTSSLRLIGVKKYLKAYPDFVGREIDPITLDGFIDQLWIDSDPDIRALVNPVFGISYQADIREYGLTYVVYNTTRSSWIKQKPAWYNLCNAKIQAKCDELGISPNGVFTLNEGFIPYVIMWYEAITNFQCETNIDINLPIQDITDVVMSNPLSISYGDLLEQMKSSYASALSWGYAFASVVKDNVSDAISYYESQIKSVISDATSKFANIVNVVRSTLADKAGDVYGFFNTAYESLGWKSVVEDTFESVDATDIYNYTGSSPLAAVNAKGVIGIAQATAKTVVAVGAGIIKGAINILGRLWRHVKPFVMALTNDPVDIGVIDKSDDSYAISNFTANSSRSSLIFYLERGVNSDLLNVVTSKVLGQWVAIQTFMAECCFRINEINAVSDNGVRVIFEWQYRPRIMNYRKALDVGLCHISDRGMTSESVTVDYVDDNDFMSKVSDYLSLDVRPEDVEDEQYLYMGIWLANALQRSVIGASFSQVQSWFRDEYNMEFRLQYDYTNHINDVSHINQSGYAAPFYYVGGNNKVVPDHVTNLDFIKMACGYESTYNTFTQFPCRYIAGQGATPDNSDHIDFATLIIPMIQIFLMQQYDKYHNPTEYLFLPYCKGTYSFTNGRYKIKTDQENRNIANILAQAIMFIAVVAITLLLCKGAIKLFKTKRMAKLTAKIGVMDNAMWNGKKLNTIEALKYDRMQKKLSKLRGGSSGLAGSPSTAESIMNQVQRITDLSTTSTTKALDNSELNKQIQENNELIKKVLIG